MKGFMRTFLGNTSNGGGGLADGEAGEGSVYNRRLSDESFKTCLNPEEGPEASDSATTGGAAEDTAASGAGAGEDASEVSSSAAPMAAAAGSEAATAAGGSGSTAAEHEEAADYKAKVARALAGLAQAEQSYTALRETVYAEKHCAQCPAECAVLRCKSCSCRVQLREVGGALDVAHELAGVKALLLEVQQGAEEAAAARLDTVRKMRKLERQVAMREMEYGWREKELEKDKERLGAGNLKLKQDVAQLQEHLLQVQEERVAQVAKLSRALSQAREENERLKAAAGSTTTTNGKDHLPPPPGQQQPQQPQPQQPQVSYFPLLGNPPLFEMAVAKVKDSLGIFTKQYMHTLKRAGLSVDIVANGLQPGILHPGMTFAHPAHVRYVFEAHISSIFFEAFEDEGYNLSSSSLAQLDDGITGSTLAAAGTTAPSDPDGNFAEYNRLKSISPSEFMEGTHDEGHFGAFCRVKFFALMSEELDEAFFGPDDQHRPLVHNGCHPESRFYEHFVLFASSVWLLHKLALSLPHPVRMFRVKSGIAFDPNFMDSIAAPASDEEEQDRATAGGATVGFMVIPGFRLGRTIFKSQVYPQWSTTRR